MQANSKGTAGASEQQHEVALCFKVPFHVRRWIKQQALMKGMTMTELVITAVEHYTNLPSDQIEVIQWRAVDARTEIQK